MTTQTSLWQLAVPLTHLAAFGLLLAGTWCASAASAHFFEAARAGRWIDASHYLVPDASQQPRGADPARRLKAVIDDTGWIDLEAVSDAHDGNASDGLTPHLEEVARFAPDGRPESLRKLCRTDDRTLISIPSGKLPSQRTEAHAARDRHRLNANLGLIYGTTHTVHLAVGAPR
jgi:hypothetical protein